MADTSRSVPLSYVEVCAGAGGLALGLHRAGWTGTGVEIDPDAAETHRRNVGPCITGDVTTTAAPHAATLVCGGVPCPDFSVAGKNLGLAGPSGQLFRDLVRFGVEAGARVLLLENVQGMVWKGAHRVIEREFQRAGFRHTHHAMLCAADFGVPQNRKRVFIVGFTDAADSARFRWPAPTHGAPGNLFGLPPWVTVREALGLGGGRSNRAGLRLAPKGKGGYGGMRSIDPDAPGWTVSTKNNADLLETSLLDCPAPTIDTTGSFNEGNGRVRSKMRAALAEVLDQPAHTVSAGGTETGGAEAFANAEYRRALASELAVAGVLDRPATTVDTKIALSAANRPRGASNKAGAVRLTWRQLAILQGFPPDYEFVGETEKSLHRSVGNAIPPPMGEALGWAIRRALGE
jgi:site-specific DNA-cytosine methylase